jgi:hypothetical protein
VRKEQEKVAAEKAKKEREEKVKKEREAAETAAKKKQLEKEKAEKVWGAFLLFYVILSVCPKLSFVCLCLCGFIYLYPYY